MDKTIDKNNTTTDPKHNEQLSDAFLLGQEAYKEVLKVALKDTDRSTRTTLIDDVDIVFEYIYLNIDTDHPTIPGTSIRLTEDDRESFIIGWEHEEDKYNKSLEEENKKELENRKNNKGFGRTFGVDRYRHTSYTSMLKDPIRIYDRFDKIEKSDKKIIFPKEFSELFWDIFQTANGKEIMFYGELTNTEENPNTYMVSGMNFPPQKNYGGYVETQDDTYEKWIFDEIILKGKKIPLHVHTHPDFGAFSSSVDERQIKQYIKDNEGNPFVIQLIVSNPRKGRYFIRWFDLENNTWEKPDVEFIYDTYDVEVDYPGIFQFDPPPRTFSSASSRFSGYSNYNNYKKWYDDFKDDRTFTDDDAPPHDDEDEENRDLSDPYEFDKYFKENYDKFYNK